MNDQLLDEPVQWSYYDKFREVDETYLPPQGEGDNMATQIVTAVTKLIYKWYNDGDVFDNTYALEGWANDLSSYANWLSKYVPEAAPILDNITTIETKNKYEQLLKKLNDTVANMEFLKEKEKLPKIGSIYNCDGPYEFVEPREDEDEDDQRDWW